jgi:hypothetical protein
MTQQPPLNTLNIEGFVPVIINITPARLPMLGRLSKK